MSKGLLLVVVLAVVVLFLFLVGGCAWEESSPASWRAYRYSGCWHEGSGYYYTRPYALPQPPTIIYRYGNQYRVYRYPQYCADHDCP